MNRYRHIEAVDLEPAPKQKRSAGDPCCEPVAYPDMEREHAIRMAAVAQPTLSHHLKKLREAAIAGSERRGLWAYYYVRPEGVSELAGWLGD